MPLDLADLAFDGCRDILQILIQLVAGPGFRAAGAQYFAGQARPGRACWADRTDCQCGSARRRSPAAVRDPPAADLHAVGKRNFGRLGNFERRQRRKLQIFVGRQNDRRGAPRFARLRKPPEARSEQNEDLHCAGSFRFGRRFRRRRGLNGVGHGAGLRNEILAWRRAAHRRR